MGDDVPPLAARSIWCTCIAAPAGYLFHKKPGADLYGQPPAPEIIVLSLGTAMRPWLHDFPRRQKEPCRLTLHQRVMSCDGGTGDVVKTFSFASVKSECVTVVA